MSISTYGAYYVKVITPRKDDEKGGFLTKEETESDAITLTKKWRKMHLDNKLIQYCWDLMPVYSMIDVGEWDEECRMKLREQLAADENFDGFVLMLYGSYFSTGTGTVDKIYGAEDLMARSKARLQSSANLHETVIVALKKASKGGPF